MRLTLNQALCNSCGKCQSACQEDAISLLGGKPNFCVQCKECIGLCKREAIALKDGIVTIDKLRCNGCGDCIRACPYRAAYRDSKGKAAICGLCQPGAPKCALACERMALTLEESRKEETAGFGWLFDDYSEGLAARMLKKEDSHVIFADDARDYNYYCTSLERPSEKEMQMILDVIELYKEYARLDLLEIPLFKPQSSRHRIKEQVARILKDYLRRHGTALPPVQANNLQEIITATVGGNLGPLDFLVYEDDLEEITFNGMPGRIHVKHKEYGRMKTNFYFTDPEYAKENIINKIASHVGKPNISERNPILAASLPNNDRLHALAAPVVPDIAFTIRHFNREPYTILDLIKSGFLSSEAAAYLWLAMEVGKTIFVVGATGTGKTTFMNSLLFFIPPDRRILCLEDVREIWAPHNDFLVHKASAQDGIRMKDLIHSSLRETPDRVVIGEVRTAEDIQAFLELAQAGPGEGSYATFHGETLETAIMRLEHHGIAAVDLPGAVHILILLKRRRQSDKKLGKNRDQRYVAEIAEVADEKGRLMKVFTYNPQKGRLAKQCRSALEAEYAEICKLNEKKVTEELEARKRMLERLSGKATKPQGLFESMKAFYTTI